MRAVVWVLVTALVAVTALLGPVASAQEVYPSRPITLIVPYAAGGVADLQARLIAARAQEILGQPIVVENQAGGAGAIALGRLASSARDGYTIGLPLTTALLATPQTVEVSFDPLNDYEWLAVFSKNVLLLVARQDSPFYTFQDVVDYARANPGRLRVGTALVGSIAHLTLLYAGEATGAQFLIIPYQSTAESMQAFLSGEVDLVGTATGTAMEYIRSGDARIVLVLDTEPWPGAPEAPTLTDVGIDLPIASLTLLAAPKGVPEDRLAILRDAFNRVIADPGFQAELRRFADPMFMSVEEFGPWAARAYEAFGRMLELAGMKR